VDGVDDEGEAWRQRMRCSSYTFASGFSSSRVIFILLKRCLHPWPTWLSASCEHSAFYIEVDVILRVCAPCMSASGISVI
jgi:hypothetical protein